MMLASQLNENLFDVNIYEKNSALGRKFLVAGKGGFNLTHAEPIDNFIARYTPTSFLENSLRGFSNTDLQEWFSSIGIKTYSGTSDRIFPIKGIKPIEVLNAILKQLEKNKVKINYEFDWKGFDANDSLVFETSAGIKKIKADITIFALGGASWKVTGSDGAWLNYFSVKNILYEPFEASNCAFKIDWPKNIISKIEGKALKNCEFICGEKTHKGEAVITKFGIEGSGVYPLSGEFRKQIHKNKKAIVYVDLKPQLTSNEIKNRIEKKGKINLTAFLEKDLKINGAKISLLKTFLSKDEFMDNEKLISKIKKFPLQIISLAPIDEAISTVGGISLSEIDEDFQLKKLYDHYIIGEMLNWDAPTGGYLLQGCFSMGFNLAKHLNAALS